MRILFISDNFPPEVNAPASRTHEHCKEWAKAGHEVTVVTCAPNFPKGIVYPGYKNRLWSAEDIDGINVVRVWSYIAANRGFFRRSVDYLSFGLSATFAALRLSKPDVVIGTSPQFFSALAARVIGKLRSVPFVFELRDLWPESIRAVGAIREGSTALALLEKLELHLYRRASLIVTVTQSFKRNLIARGISQDKIQVVTNGVDQARYQPRAKNSALVRRFGLENRVVFGYVGTHGMAHALETLLRAAGELEARGLEADFKLLLVGDGARRSLLMQQAMKMGLSTVEFIDSVPKDEVPDYWGLLDVSIIHLRRTPLFETVIPSKLFECFGMGIPVLLGVAGESAEIVQREQAGIAFEPENHTELAKQMEVLMVQSALRSELANNAVLAASKYDRSSLATKMLTLLEGL